MKRLYENGGRRRIGFIAMSGVRAQNTELMEAGLTLPGFVERSKVIASLPSLSLLTLAALTPEDVDVEYHEIIDLQTCGELPADFDLVAITSLSAQVLEAYRVAERYRALGIPVVMGGLHVSSVPQEALAYCDCVVVGEGELVWPKLLEDFFSGRLQRRYEARAFGEFDLADAPVPRFDLLDPAKYNRLTIQTSRGCPHRCEFCASSILLTPRYKLKPVDKVIAEVRAIKKIWPDPFIEFADDNSFANRAHYKVLMEALVAEKIRWFTETDISVAEDPHLLDLMARAGCKQVLIGLESPAGDAIRGVENRSDWKARQQSHYLENIQRIQSRGITVNGCFILGLDGDGPEVFDRVFEFVRRSSLFEVQVTFLTPFPGTPLYARLAGAGRLLEPENWDLCTLFDINFHPSDMTVDQLQSGFLRLCRRLYSEKETMARKRRFFTNLRRSASSGAAVGLAS